ncbi:methyltransferase domain-containing protein [Dokdonella ginsengisoli]|uniref:Methyltransferase domain-containing protein n=1 Tax=Dokdonella ginsengisoli TaxID=363846 RepID=A0ABV9QWD8_9GAMM
MNDEVNSKDYWNRRFRTDWREFGGPQQTEMFARIALRLMPPWLSTDIHANMRSLLDAGCAEGEAVALFRRRFGHDCRIEGIDFSEEAVERASAKHGDGFRTGDLTALDSDFDVIFSSNTLEHFPDPLAVLDAWTAHAKHHVVLLLPFWEWRRESEHAFTFDHASLPASIAGRFVCTHFDVQNTAKMPNTSWYGFQALIVYSSLEAIERLRLSVDQLGHGLQPRSLSVDEVISARAFGSTMHHAAALADEQGSRLVAYDERLSQTVDAVNALSRAIEEQSRQLQQGRDEQSRQLQQEREEQSRQLQQEREAAESSGRNLQQVLETLNAVNGATLRNDERLAGVEKRIERAFASLQAERSGHALAELVSKSQQSSSVLLDTTARKLDAAIARQGEALGEKIHILEAQIGAQREVQALQAEVLALRTAAAAADIDIARLSASEHALAQELEREREKVSRLMTSSSWRITGPLRSVAGSWYRFRGSSRKQTLQQVSEAPHVPPLETPALGTVVEPPRQDLVIVDEHRSALQEILERHAGMPIVVLRPVVDWDLPLFQRPHHIAARLAKAGYLYFYCTPNGRDGVSGFRRLDDNLYLTDQFLLVNRIPGGKVLHLYSTDNHCTPDYVNERLSAGDRLMYEYIDEIHPSISGFAIPPHVMEKHAMLLGRPDVLCIASADKLYHEVDGVRDGGLVMATNGVEHEHFHGRGRQNPPAAIASLVALGKPIIGYFGAFAVWFDYELVARLASARPDYSILLLGWDYDGSLDRSGIKQYPNVHVLGPIPYQELPDYARFFDVSTIPFLINDITESTSPIKLFEYMSLEHPIVTTNLPECRKYASVMVARDHGQFIALVDRALDMRGDTATRELLRTDARANTWDSKAAAIAAAIAGQWPEYAPVPARREQAA